MWKRRLEIEERAWVHYPLHVPAAAAALGLQLLVLSFVRFGRSSLTIPGGAEAPV